MSKPKFTLSILVSLASLCLEVPIQAQPGETKPEAATVSGAVTLKGEPARGVPVLLQRQQSDMSSSLRARTDEEGRFRFMGVAAGRYSVYALMPGHTSPDDNPFGLRGRALNIAEGEKVENIELEIKRGGVIAGRITDSRGRPVIEETVTLYKLDKSGRPMVYWLNDPYHGMYQTDDRGAYRIFGLPEGRYRVSVGQDHKPGSAGLTLSALFYPRVFYPNATGEAEARVIEVTEGSEATDIDITVPDPQKPHNVYGRVVEADSGRPVEGLELSIGGLTQDGKLTGGMAGAGRITDSNGEFRLGVMTPGKYILMVDTDGGSDDGFIAEPVIFDISDGDVAGLEVKLRQAGSISGVVVIEGTNDPKILSKLSQVKISGFYTSMKYTILNMPIRSGIADVKVNADGSFGIGGLQPGNVSIRMRPSPELRGLTVARIERGRATRGGIDVKAGEQVSGVRIVLVYGSLAIRGEVKVVGGALPAGVKLSVTARRMDQGEQALLSAYADGRGQFLIEGAPSGEYEIGIYPHSNLYGEQLDQKITQLVSSVRERVVLAGADAQPVVLVVDLNKKDQ